MKILKMRSGTAYAFICRHINNHEIFVIFLILYSFNFSFFKFTTVVKTKLIFLKFISKWPPFHILSFTKNH